MSCVAFVLTTGACDPDLLGPSGYDPRVMSIVQTSDGLFVSLVDTQGGTACSSGDPSVSVNDARQVIVSLGAEPFEPGVKVPLGGSCPPSVQSGVIPAACGYDRTFDATGGITSTALLSNAAVTVSTATCSAGCLLEVDITLDGVASLLLAELPAGEWPRCSDAGEFAFAPL